MCEYFLNKVGRISYELRTRISVLIDILFFPKCSIVAKNTDFQDQCSSAPPGYIMLGT